MAAAAIGARASPLAIAMLAAALFLLSADLLHVGVAGYKLKYGYFMVAALWMLRPEAMLRAVGGVRAPRWPFLLAIPIALTVGMSLDVKGSIWWALWLGFDVFAAITVYAFVKVHRFTEVDVVRSVAVALALIALGGLVQFVAIYVRHEIVFDPQKHFDLYRINGLAGWPHFLCIFTFLLLPIVVTQGRVPLWQKAIVAMVAFVLVQSTAKTGWALFIALGSLLLWFDRTTFTRNFMLLLLPLTVIALLIPTPTAGGGTPRLSGSEKVHVFSEDLDLSNKTTSGSDRVLINEMGLAVFARHPWFGVGPRAFDTYAFTRFDRELPGVNKLDANGNVNAKNENIWVEWLSECGILFTLLAAAVIVRALWVPGFVFRNPLHLGAWMALVMYFALSGQVSQSGLLTLVYAVFGIYFYSRELPGVAKSQVLTRARGRLTYESLSPLGSTTRPGT